MVESWRERWYVVDAILTAAGIGGGAQTASGW